MSKSEELTTADTVGEVFAAGSHTNEATALLVPDYPYGFTLRTQIRYWVETSEKLGQRFCSQTLNPRNGRWNAPKKGTYAPIVVLYRERESGHVKHASLCAWWDLERLWDFEGRYGPALGGAYESHRLALIKEGATRRAARSTDSQALSGFGSEAGVGSDE